MGGMTLAMIISPPLIVAGVVQRAKGNAEQGNHLIFAAVTVENPLPRHSDPGTFDSPQSQTGTSRHP